MTYIFGVVLGVVASIIGYFGKIAIKHSHVLDSNGWFGFGLFLIVIVHPVFSMLSYRFASQSVLSPLAGLSILWNTILSPKLLNQRIPIMDVVNAVLIFAGCIVIAIVGNHGSNALPVNDISKHFKSDTFADYVIGGGLVGFTLMIIALPALLTTCHHKEYLATDPMNMSVYSAIEDCTKDYDPIKEYHPKVPTDPNGIQYLHPGFLGHLVSHRITRMGTVALAGFVSGQMYFLSATMRILDDGNSIFHQDITYAVIGGAIGCATLGLGLLNLSLRLYDVMFTIYIYESCYIIASTVSGLCFFDEMKSLAPWHHVAYISSIVVILIGIHNISRRESDLDVAIPHVPLQPVFS